jgi:hypothetical protein
MVMVVPMHNVDGPLTGNGVAFTVNKTADTQPAVDVQVIVAVPADAPVTVPLDEPTVAIVGLADVHIPPIGVALSVDDEPTQACAVPVTTGRGLTVTMAVAAHDKPGPNE